MSLTWAMNVSGTAMDSTVSLKKKKKKHVAIARGTDTRCILIGCWRRKCLAEKSGRHEPTHSKPELNKVFRLEFGAGFQPWLRRGGWRWGGGSSARLFWRSGLLWAPLLTRVRTASWLSSCPQEPPSVSSRPRRRTELWRSSTRYRFIKSILTVLVDAERSKGASFP